MREGDDWLDKADSCSLLPQGSGSSKRKVAPRAVSEDDVFVIETILKRGEATVIFRTASDVQEIELEREFLKSKKKRSTTIITDAGTEYRSIHWGGDECEKASPDDLEERSLGGAGGASRD